MTNTFFILDSIGLRWRKGSPHVLRGMYRMYAKNVQMSRVKNNFHFLLPNLRPDEGEEQKKGRVWLRIVDKKGEGKEQSNITNEQKLS